jgi:queuine tRNA-ribosyltransferase
MVLYVDHAYSRAYLRHLVISKEMLGAQIASIHNLAFYLWLVEEARNQILADNYRNWKDDIIKKLKTRL